MNTLAAHSTCSAVRHTKTLIRESTDLHRNSAKTLFVLHRNRQEDLRWEISSSALYHLHQSIITLNLGAGDWQLLCDIQPGGRDRRALLAHEK